MRYIKVLVLAVFFFLALVFFFQNQTVLAQQLQLVLNLFFIPTFTSITLPFYFLIISAFLLGALMSVFLLMWDKFATTARLVKKRWQVSSLQNEVIHLNRQLDRAKKELAELKTRALPAGQSLVAGAVPHENSEKEVTVKDAAPVKEEGGEVASKN